MRTTRRTSRFKRDYRRELSGVLGKKLESWVRPVVELLADDTPLPQRYVDDALSASRRTKIASLGATSTMAGRDLFTVAANLLGTGRRVTYPGVRVAAARRGRND